MAVLTRTLEMIPIGDKAERDRIYTWIRSFMDAQSKMMNQYMSALYIAAIQEISKEDRQELNKLYNRIPTSSKGSAFDKEIELPKGLGAAYGQTVRADFDTSCENGLLHGRVALPTYKRDYPIIIPPLYVQLRKVNQETKGKNCGFYEEYDSYNDLYDALTQGEPEIFWSFVDKMIFKIRFGNPYKSAFLRSEILHFLEGEYKAMGSSLSINNKGKIILSLTMEIPEKKVKLDENTVCGVSLGFMHPIVCSVNNNFYKKEFIGDYDVFVDTRVRLQEQRRELQKKLKYASSSHGRVKKLRKLDILRKREANFAKTMNHKMSSDIVKFAVKNEAKYINMQDLTSFGKDNRDNIKSGYEFALRNWSYFQLQQMVTYKAATYGIVVRKISNDNLSDTCSICGAEGIIEDGAFICSDPNCLSHDKYEKARKNGKGNYYFNSDFNISRNASISENFTTKKRKSKAEKKEERKAKKEKENLDKT